ncbi:MAG: hypothetical protein AB7G93_03775 [Bdellovibrionales bacterium]
MKVPKFARYLTIMVASLAAGSLFAAREMITVNAKVVGTGVYDISGHLKCSLLESREVAVKGNNGPASYLFSKYLPTYPVELSATTEHKVVGGFVSYARVTVGPKSKDFEYPLGDDRRGGAGDDYEIMTGPFGVKITHNGAAAIGEFDERQYAVAILADETNKVAVKCEFEPLAPVFRFIDKMMPKE